jgi:hypothetical protein
MNFRKIFFNVNSTHHSNHCNEALCVTAPSGINDVVAVCLCQNQDSLRIKNHSSIIYVCCDVQKIVKKRLSKRMSTAIDKSCVCRCKFWRACQHCPSSVGSIVVKEYFRYFRHFIFTFILYFSVVMLSEHENDILSTFRNVWYQCLLLRKQYIWNNISFFDIQNSQWKKNLIMSTVPQYICWVSRASIRVSDVKNYIQCSLNLNRCQVLPFAALLLLLHSLLEFVLSSLCVA